MNAQALREWRTHWPLVLVSALGMGLSVMHFYSIGLFMAPLEAAFGWSRSQVSSGLLISSVVAVTCAPFIGWLIDRWGSRVFVISGTVVYCAGLASLSLVNGSLWSWWIAWVLVAIGSLLLKPTVWTASIAAKFDKGRGLALAVTLSGNGIGSAIYPTLAASLIAAFGWRGAYLALGLLGIVLVMPLVLLFFTDSKANKASAGKPAAEQTPLPGVDAREGMLSRRFVQLAVAGFFMTFSLTATTVHLVPMLSAGGMTRGAAAAAAASVGIAAIVGRIGTGFLLDLMSGVRVGALAFLLPMIPTAMLLTFGGSFWHAVAIGTMLGLSLGAEIDVIAYLATRYFGLRNFGLIFGSIVGLLSFSTGTGSLVASMVYDSFGSYHWFNLLMLPVFVLSALLIATLGPYPDFTRADPTTRAE